MTTLADRLRWVLAARQLSARGLSKAAGLSPPHVGMVLRGDIQRVSADHMARIAQAAQVSIGWLVTGEGGAEGDAPQPPSPQKNYAAFPSWGTAAKAALARAIPPWAVERAGRMVGPLPHNGCITPEIVIDLALIVIKYASGEHLAAAPAEDAPSSTPSLHDKTRAMAKLKPARLAL